MDEESKPPHREQKIKSCTSIQRPIQKFKQRNKVAVGLTTGELEDLLREIPPDERQAR